MKVWVNKQLGMESLNSIYMTSDMIALTGMTTLNIYFPLFH